MELRLSKITSKNFMKLEDGEYDLFGSVGFIQGRNSQGKSSLLSLMEYALGKKVGAGLRKPIRVNEEAARIVCEYRSETDEPYYLVVEFKDKGDRVSSTVYVETKDGAKIRGVKNIREFLGDPPEMVDVTEVAKNQGKASGREANLKNLFQPLLGIDMSEQLEAIREGKAERRDLSKTVKELEGMFATAKVSPEEALQGAKVKDPEPLKTKLIEEEGRQRAYDEAKDFLGRAGDLNKGLIEKHEEAKSNANKWIKDRKEAIEAKIAELQDELKNLAVPDYMHLQIRGLGEQMQELAAKQLDSEKIVEKGPSDIDKARAELDDVAAYNTRVSLINDMQKNAKRLIGLQSEVSSIDERITSIQHEINEAISSASSSDMLPDRFLFAYDDEFDTVNIFYKDPETGDVVPFTDEQVAQSQLVLGSMALTLAAFKASQAKTRFITVKDAALLDKRSMAELIKMAEAAGFDVYPEIVTEDDGVSVKIYKDYETAIRERAIVA